MIIDTQETEKYKAKNMLLIAKWHKKTCNVSDCGISTYLLLEDFEKHMGRKATQKEFANFM